jgi:hypothetical protein
MKTWIIAVVLSLALSAPGAPVAFAQAGSTGGTVGKQDKSVSGGDTKSEVGRAAKSPAHNSTERCGGIVGVWAFSNGVDVSVNPDGGATANGWHASWTCQANVITIRWPAFVDNYTIGSDGRSLSGASGLTGEHLTARRK